MRNVFHVSNSKSKKCKWLHIERLANRSCMNKICLDCKECWYRKRVCQDSVLHIVQNDGQLVLSQPFAPQLVYTGAFFNCVFIYMFLCLFVSNSLFWWVRTLKVLGFNVMQQKWKARFHWWWARGTLMTFCEQMSSISWKH